jgi:hypothetical protein
VIAKAQTDQNAIARIRRNNKLIMPLQLAIWADKRSLTLVCQFTLMLVLLQAMEQGKRYHNPCSNFAKL